MWFKNLNVFRLTEPFALSAAELEQKLQPASFRPCAPHEESSFGWTPPIGKMHAPLVHSSNGFIMLCGKKEERVLPTAVINEMTQERIADAEDKQDQGRGIRERVGFYRRKGSHSKL